MTLLIIYGICEILRREGRTFLIHAALVLGPLFFFRFNTPCQIKTPLNLRFLIFCLTPFGWLLYYCNPLFLMGIQFLIYVFFI